MTTCLGKSCSFGLCGLSFPYWYLGWNAGCDCINSGSLPFNLLYLLLTTVRNFSVTISVSPHVCFILV